MKKYSMIFGLALLVGIGIFSLTESLAANDVSENVLTTSVPQTCFSSCSGGTTCGATLGTSCSAKTAAASSSTNEAKAAGCGCSKGIRS